MANLMWWIEITKYNLICMKLGNLEFFGSLIPNQESNFENSKWPIKYGEMRSQNIT